MHLKDFRFLIIDCQTTGIRPKVGNLLELAWGWSKASDDDLEVTSRLLCLPEGRTIPRAVREITGIHSKDMANAVDPLEVRREFLQVFGSERPLALIHYAQFETAFLEDFLHAELADGLLPFDMICTHALSKKLFPQVPSRNVRGLSGFLGLRIGEVKRAAEHVRATHAIWKGLVAELEIRGVFTLEELQQWMKAAPKTKRTLRFEYRIDKAKRLALPDRPGVYKMLSKEGEILYVGKATSLKDRVNSYFRGRKGRDPRKLEMMAQAWDLEVVECESPLEAALLESDEIKKWDPPYNVSLKAGARKLVFYSRDFSSFSESQDDEHRIGPFRMRGAIEPFLLLAAGLRGKVLPQPFFEPIDFDLLQNGLVLFLARNELTPADLADERRVMAWAMRRLRSNRFSTALRETQDAAEELECAENSESDESDDQVEATLTAEDVAGKFERLYERAAAELLRARRLTRLLNADIESGKVHMTRSLSIRDGRIEWYERGVEIVQTDIKSSHPWRNLGIADYDRMSILLSAIDRRTSRSGSQASTDVSDHQAFESVEVEVDA